MVVRRTSIGPARRNVPHSAKTSEKHECSDARCGELRSQWAESADVSAFGTIGKPDHRFQEQCHQARRNDHVHAHPRTNRRHPKAGTQQSGFRCASLSPQSAHSANDKATSIRISIADGRRTLIVHCFWKSLTGQRTHPNPNCLLNRRARRSGVNARNCRAGIMASPCSWGISESWPRYLATIGATSVASMAAPELETSPPPKFTFSTGRLTTGNPIPFAVQFAIGASSARTVLSN